MIKNRTGQKFGKLTCIEFVRINNQHSAVWKCLCDCGNLTETSITNLKKGHTKSCGCLQGLPRHGMWKTTEYKIWSGIKARCLNKHRKEYKNYGGRGILICEEWKNSFESFFKDMGYRPSKNHTIDRIDNNGNYCKSNCRWSDRTTQIINSRKRVTNTSGKTGVSRCPQGWEASITVNYESIILLKTSNKEEAVAARREAELKYFGKYLDK